MPGQPLAELEEQRARLFAQLAAVGDFRPGSINVTYRRCGKPNCACAQEGHPGHGPRYLLTRSEGGKTRSRQLRGGEVEKAAAEVAAYRQFVSINEQIVEVSEAICEARPAAASQPPAVPPGERGGLGGAFAAEAAAEIERLAAAAAASLTAGGQGLEAAELAIRTAMARLGGRLLEQLLAADGGRRGPRADCGAGHQAQFASYRAKVIDTVLGPIRLRRAWYHCAACKHGLAPRDGELGLARSSMSPGLRAMAARAATAVPFAKASALLAELAGVSLTTKRIERSAEADGTAASAVITARAQAACSRQVVPLPPPGPLPDMLYIAVDGTGVPMVAAATRGRPGKGPDGQAHTREVKLACCFTQTSLSEDGHPVRDPRSSSYLATFEPAAAFARLVDAEARRRGSEHIRQLVILGDGAAWIWNIADDLFPAATQIVDLFHAREHVHELAALATRLLRKSHPGWLAGRLAELDAGDVPALLTAGRALNFIGSLARERDRQLAYFDVNAHRMRYAHFRDLGMFIGSGAVEAGCKAVIGQRLKLSGMRWNIPGATAIATLRCQEASNRREEIWQRPHNQTQTAQPVICQQPHTQTAAG